jgi:hypothetical protein
LYKIVDGFYGLLTKTYPCERKFCQVRVFIFQGCDFSRFKVDGVEYEPFYEVIKLSIGR